MLQLWGCCFATLKDLKAAIYMQIEDIDKEGLYQGVLKLPHRWNYVIAKEGDYIEGL